MQQKRRNKTNSTVVRTIVTTLAVTALVVGAANALTLDSAVTRTVPYLQKLLITDQGDQTSNSVVELSGTNGQLVRMLPVMGTSTILQAPLGRFLRLSQISGSAFAPGSIGSQHIITGSLTLDDFAFNITTYSFLLGGGGVNDGSCPAGEVATAFSGGNIVCSPAILANLLPTPLCGPGDTFIGWLGILTPSCMGTSIGLGGSDYWQPTPSNPSDIYYGIASGWNSYGFGTGGVVPGVEILELVATTIVDPNFGYIVSPASCSCSNFGGAQDCIVYSGGATPPGYIADSTTQAFINPMTTGYAFADPATYPDWNPPYSTPYNMCSDWFIHTTTGGMYGGPLMRINTFKTVGPTVSWSTPVYSGIFQGNEKVGVGLDHPLESLHVSSSSTGMTITSSPGVMSTGIISYTTGPLMGSLYGVRLGVLTNGYHCPCDNNAGAADSCSMTYFNQPYPTYNYALGSQSCYDVDASNNGYYTYPMFVSFASNIFGLQIGASGTFHSFGMPRCSCDINDSDGNCQEGQMNITYPSIPWVPSDAYYFHGPNQGPSCYEIQWGGGSPGYGLGPWSVTKWDKVMDEYYWHFKYLGNGSAAASGLPKCSCDTSPTTLDCTNPTFIGINPTNAPGYSCNDYTKAPVMYSTYMAMTGVMSSTGTMLITTGTYMVTSATGGLPTFRSDDQGTIYSLVQNAENLGAGTVGALTVSYQGANLYVNGGAVGVNNSDPQAALDVVGDVRMSTLINPPFNYLSVDNNGYLLVTGNTNTPTPSQWLPTTTTSGLSAIQFTPISGAAVLIGLSHSGPGPVGWPTLKLIVNSGVQATSMWVYSDTGLKYDITLLNNILPKLLSVNGYTFKWLQTNQQDAGLLASEIYNQFPTAVRFMEHPKYPGQIKVVNYQSLIGALIQGIREIHDKLQDAGTERLAEQRSKINKLFWRVESLEQGSRWDGNPRAEVDWNRYGGGQRE